MATPQLSALRQPKPPSLGAKLTAPLRLAKTCSELLQLPASDGSLAVAGVTLCRPAERQRQPRQRASRVDFGFRPDGAGEDPVEEWSLFRVSRGPGRGGDAGGRLPRSCDASRAQGNQAKVTGRAAASV